ncbi:OLC1v1034584C3 [Oldenlandia corymbosa var. corymbosa]|uniref:OLC1v1034584C3 n=1 Tax=Oldenlandia corymbosa var. corymbosa TaxID=529605 RepID=A0AAV1CS85_OLDCO|nr:OLC1v1034584C3 [Oldenlandia corymbosa var. corymbosa]
MEISPDNSLPTNSNDAVVSKREGHDDQLAVTSGGAAAMPPTVHKVEESMEIVEEASTSQQNSRQDLVLDIPGRTAREGFKEDFVRINVPQSSPPTPKRVNFSPLPSPSDSRFNGSPLPSSHKAKPSVKNLLPKLSFKFRNTNAEIEKAAMLALGSPLGSQEKTSITRTFSLSKLFTPRMKRTSSLPSTPVLHSNPESFHGRNGNSAKGGTFYPIHRSRSVPALNKDGSVRQTEYSGGIIRVVPATPRVTEHHMPSPDASVTVDIEGSGNDAEDIPQEEAVCRICLVELGEGSETLKMECNCKGELALAHQDCAVKWFSIKGNRTCDVCKQEVKNLPVTLLRIQDGRSRGSGVNPIQVHRYRVLQDVPVLVIVSMLAYFCFLEQLLVIKMGSGAIAISLPFSCILGLLASMTSTTMVRRRFAWIYATVQFILVVVFAHIFYSLVREAFLELDFGVHLWYKVYPDSTF